jgi:phosphate uptake regulator
VHRAIERPEHLHLILLIRSLERVGDLPSNIGEDAVFPDNARDIRHETDRSMTPGQLIPIFTR